MVQSERKAPKIPKKLTDIEYLQEQLTKSKEDNQELKARVTEAERSATQTSNLQQDLLEALIEGGVL